MSVRRKAREYALQMLYQCDVSGQEPPAVQAAFWKNARAAKPTRDFANELFEGTVGWIAELDRVLASHAHNWRLDRMSAIDRSILRMSAYELRYCSDTPAKVVINEAVELAKKFSDADSPGFINGILDAVRKSAEETSASPDAKG